MARTSDKSVVLILCLIFRSHWGFLISEDPTAICIDVTCRSQRHQQTPDGLNIKIPPSLDIRLRKQTYRETQENNVTSVGHPDEKLFLSHAEIITFLIPLESSISCFCFSVRI